MSIFTSPLGSQIERFLAHKRALGLIYHREEAFLREFDRFVLREQDEAVLSDNLVRAYFAAFGQAARPNRLTLIRQLARFLIFEEPRTFVPSSRFLFRAGPGRFWPRLSGWVKEAVLPWGCGIRRFRVDRR